MKRLYISLITGAAVSTAALFLAFQNIPFKDLIQYFSKIDYFWILPALIFGLFSFIIRVARWMIIINATGTAVPFGLTYHTLMTGFMLNCVLPGRIGEVARPAILRKQKDIPFTTGLATIVAERLFDMITLLLLFTLLLSTIDISPDLVISFGGYKVSAKIISDIFSGIISFSVILTGGIIAVNVPVLRNMITKTIMKIPDGLFFLSNDKKRAVHKRFSLPLKTMTENFAGGFSMLKNPARIIVCLLLSFAVWSIQAVSYYMISFGCPGIELTFIEISTVMIIICFAISLPSVPGYWGLWEAGGIFALAVFSVARGSAAGYTLVNHVVQVIPVIIIGAVSAIIIGININQLYNKR